jgi:hypothetical protein
MASHQHVSFLNQNKTMRVVFFSVILLFELRPRFALCDSLPLSVSLKIDTVKKPAPDGR